MKAIWIIEREIHDPRLENYPDTGVDYDLGFYTDGPTAQAQVDALNAPLQAAYQNSLSEDLEAYEAGLANYDQKVLEHQTLTAAGITPSEPLPAKPQPFRTYSFETYLAVLARQVQPYTLYEAIEIEAAS